MDTVITQEKTEISCADEISTKDMSTEDMSTEGMDTESMNSEDMSTADMNSEGMDTESMNSEDMSTEDMSTEEKAFQNMRKARSELLLAHPFFGSLALRLELKSDTHCRDLWTDGKTLAFNPLYASSLSKEQLIGAQAHEIMHLACGHHVRRKGRNENLWNKACDFAINYILYEAGFKLPDAYRHDPLYEDKSVDDIYVALLRLYDQELHGGAENANVAERTDENEEAGSLGGLNADENEQDENEQDNKEAKNAEAEQSDEENEKTQKNKAVKEDDDLDEGKKDLQNTSADFHGEVKDHPLLSDESNDSDQKKAEQEAQINLAQAIQSSPNMGDIPLGLLRLFKNTIRPALDWRALLQRFIENCNDGDYTWSMPNKRYISQNIYLPSRKEPRIPYMALAVDASGSVDAEALSSFCAELENILESYDTNLLVVYHDIKVQGHGFYSREDRPLRLFPKGGGGTDFRPIPEFLEREDFTPACLLWFTDMECDLFPDEPPYPVLWISSKRQNFEPPFGDIIYLTG